MKRRIIIIAAAMGLAGCAGVDLDSLGNSAVRVTETLTEESTSTARGVTAGMGSSDAANTIMTREYYSTIRTIVTSMKPIVDIEAMDGEPIKIYAKSFKVYAPSPMAGGGGGFALAPPQKVEPLGLKIFDRSLQALERVFIPWYKIDNDNELGKLNILTNADLQRFIAQNDSNLLRDLVGTKPDPASLDRAEADRIRIEANRASPPD